jgi:hypothetical protein
VDFIGFFLEVNEPKRAFLTAPFSYISISEESRKREGIHRKEEERKEKIF